MRAFPRLRDRNARGESVFFICDLAYVRTALLNSVRFKLGNCVARYTFITWNIGSSVFDLRTKHVVIYLKIREIQWDRIKRKDEHLKSVCHILLYLLIIQNELSVNVNVSRKKFRWATDALENFRKSVRNQGLIPMRIMTYPRSSQLPAERSASTRAFKLGFEVFREDLSSMTNLVGKLDTHRRRCGCSWLRSQGKTKACVCAYVYGCACPRTRVCGVSGRRGKNWIGHGHVVRRSLSFSLLSEAKKKPIRATRRRRRSEARGGKGPPPKSPCGSSVSPRALGMLSHTPSTQRHRIADTWRVTPNIIWAAWQRNLWMRDIVRLSRRDGMRYLATSSTRNVIRTCCLCAWPESA